MKEDYDTMGPEATIQTTVNNGTGKDVYHAKVMRVLDHVDSVSQEQERWPIHLYVHDFTIKSDFTRLLIVSNQNSLFWYFIQQILSFILKPLICLWKLRKLNWIKKKKENFQSIH